MVVECNCNDMAGRPLPRPRARSTRRGAKAINSAHTHAHAPTPRARLVACKRARNGHGMVLGSVLACKPKVQRASVRRGAAALEVQ